jgi:GT2 family glycosyltransferase
MKVCAVMVNYRTAEKTIESLERLLADLETIEARVVIVDNDSQDGSEEKIRTEIQVRRWGVRVILVQAGRNGGFGAGNNVGIRWDAQSGSPSEYIMLINPDAYPESGTCRMLVEFMERNPEAGILGTAIRGIDGILRRSAFRFPTAQSEFEAAIRWGPITRLFGKRVVAPPIPDANICTEWVSGSCMMIRTRLFDDVESFDESFFLYFEEVDFCRRAAAANWKIYWIKDATIVHDAGYATGIQNITRPRPKYWFDSRQYYFRKNHGVAYLWLANMAWLGGNVGWRIRCWIKHEPTRAPPRLMRDFLRYSFW